METGASVRNYAPLCRMKSTAGRIIIFEARLLLQPGFDGLLVVLQ